MPTRKRKPAPVAPLMLFSLSDGQLSLRLPWRMVRGNRRKPDGREFFSIAQAARAFKVDRVILIAQWISACASLLTAAELAAARKALSRRPRSTQK